MYALSLMPGRTVPQAVICAWSSEYRHERGLQARSGKYSIISNTLVTRVALRLAAVGLEKDGSEGKVRGSDPRVSRKKLTGYEDTYLAGHDPTRSVTF